MPVTQTQKKISVQSLLYDSDRERIVSTVLRMGDLVSKALNDAVHALFDQDREAAGRIIRNDDLIDSLEEEVDQECLGSIAMRSPKKEELYFVFAVLKIITDLERIGDQAVNIAKKVFQLTETMRFPREECILSMTEKVLAMFSDALVAFRRGDGEMASELWKRDDEVDDMYAECYSDFLENAMAGTHSGPEAVRVGALELWAARHLERAGDHVINIAERVFFMVEGKYFPSKEERKKAVK